MSLPFELNRCLKALPVYQPGRPIEDVARELGIPAESIVKMASNENPLGPSPLAMEAIRKTIAQIHYYPDGNAFYLKEKLARKLAVSPAQLAFGAGSNDVLELIAHAMLSPGDDVVVSQYCFAVYPIVTCLFGARLIVVPAKSYGHDLAAMAKAITPKTRVVFVANPNNPTGTLASREEILAFIQAVPASVLVVMDEAYFEFLDQPFDLLPLVREGKHPNLLIARTFSKIYGLAGLRLGYAIGHAEVIAALEKVRQPFNTNLLAQVAALAAIDDTEHLKRTKANNSAGLAYFVREFKKLGLEHLPPHANFILVKVGDGQKVFQTMQKAGVIVRPLAGYQLPEWVRVTVGTPAENSRCLEALKKALALA